MSDPKCAQLAGKLSTLHDLLTECYLRGVPERLEAEHNVLIREFDRLNTEWKALGCERAGLNFTRVDIPLAPMNAWDTEEAPAGSHQVDEVAVRKVGRS